MKFYLFYSLISTDLQTYNHGADLREEFHAVNEYFQELHENYKKRASVDLDRLTKIRDLIRHCDVMAETPKEKSIVARSAHFWNKCREIWIANNPSEDIEKIEELKLKTAPEEQATRTVDPLPEKKKSFDKCLDKNDRMFLKSLRIKID